MPEEKRKADRIKKPLVIQYGYIRQEDNQKIWDETTIRDISETGISFRAARRFATGAPIILRINLPSNPLEWTEVNVEVVDSAESAIGIHMTRVKFMDLGEQEKKLIGECVAWFLGKDGGRYGA